MPDDLDPVRQLLPHVRLHPLEALRAGERSDVRRVEACWPDATPTTLIVKRLYDLDESWVRETAALSVLPPGEASALVASGTDPPLVVTEDLGGGPSVADALLGDDQDVAWRAVRQWAVAVGRLHAATASLREAFEQQLHQRSPEVRVPPSRVSRELDDAARVLDGHCAALGVPVPTGALDELRELRHLLGSDGTAALTPADTCPDNNVRVGDRVVLTDFEGAQWRHVAWDVAYLFVPWPSCWCAWSIPDELARQAFADYRAAAAPGLPAVADDLFEREVRAATAGWALTSTTWYLDSALGEDPPVNPQRPAPTRRAMVLRRLALAAASDALPALAELAAELGGELDRRWGDVPLETARAFAGD